VARDGKLKSTNTDVEGPSSLDQAAWLEQADRTAVVLGPGGTARAVVFGLVERSRDDHVVNHATTGDWSSAVRPSIKPAQWWTRLLAR
jgi:shikimate dehydrogenase